MDETSGKWRPIEQQVIKLAELIDGHLGALDPVSLEPAPLDVVINGGLGDFKVSGSLASCLEMRWEVHAMNNIL